MALVHVDTDIGGDPDDLCALAMLLGWPGVELEGVTTSTDEGGARAGLVSYALPLAGRGGIPVAAGAQGSSRAPALLSSILAQCILMPSVKRH